MRIRLKSFFYFDVTRIFDDNQIELAVDRPTLRSLLEEVVRKTYGKVQIIDPEANEIDAEYFVLVNGKESQALPQGLETALRDGDEVGIGMMHFWGGG
jgi:molybdopterin converting factor small subunit